MGCFSHNERIYGCLSHNERIYGCFSHNERIMDVFLTTSELEMSSAHRERVSQYVGVPIGVEAGPSVCGCVHQYVGVRSQQVSGHFYLRRSLQVSGRD